MTSDKAQNSHQTAQTAKQGHCSRCGRVWTLATPQGVCQWCGKQASCQTSTAKPRSVKTRRRRQPPRPVIGNGYDQLPDPHLTYYRIAVRIAVKVLTDDQEDLLHDIIIHLDRVAERKRARGEQFSEAGIYRTAEHVKDHYWYDLRKRTSGLDCGNCSTKQRRKCKEDWLYGDCPKLVKLESLNKPIIDSEGNMTELGDLIADDTALDLDAWLDCKQLFLDYPRLKRIAKKIADGDQLAGAERVFLHKLRRQEQKKLL